MWVGGLEWLIERASPLLGTWTELPSSPAMPKEQMRLAFEELGALYVLYWGRDEDGSLRARANYESKRGARLRRRLRGDGDSFVARSYSYIFPPDDAGPLLTCAREKSEIVVVAGPDDSCR